MACRRDSLSSAIVLVRSSNQLAIIISLCAVNDCKSCISSFYAFSSKPFKVSSRERAIGTFPHGTDLLCRNVTKCNQATSVGWSLLAKSVQCRESSLIVLSTRCQGEKLVVLEQLTLQITQQ